MTEVPFPLLKAKDIDSLKEDVRRHQFNENAIRHTKPLSDLLGLSTIGVNVSR